jgi:hypothetical protein
VQSSDPNLPSSSGTRGSTRFAPDEEDVIEQQVLRVRQEKREALKDPGPSWGDWFFFGGAKWYVIMGYLIVLSWEASYLFPSSLARIPFYEVVPVIAGTVYGEFLLYRYLWYQPPARSRSTRPDWVDSRWFRPLPYGRWTEEGVAIRSGKLVIDPDRGPDPREFL